jgi:hypothetical protein
MLMCRHDSTLPTTSGGVVTTLVRTPLLCATLLVPAVAVALDVRAQGGRSALTGSRSVGLLAGGVSPALSSSIAILVKVAQSHALGEVRLERQDVHRRGPAAGDPSLDLLVDRLSTQEGGDTGRPLMVVDQARDGRKWSAHASSIHN